MSIFSILVPNIYPRKVKNSVLTIFSKITCPVLLIRGSSDFGSLITEIDLKATLKLMPQLKDVKINHAGHSPMRQDTEAVVNAINEFVL